jgi:PKD repeat protein
LTVTDNKGGRDIAEQTITIRILPSSASFIYSPTSPTAGQEVSFTDSSTVPEGRTITSWSWNFGDGYTSTVQNPMHKYETPGSYTVTLTVKDDLGLEDSYSSMVDVKPDYTVYIVIGVVLATVMVSVIIFKSMRRKKFSDS